MIIFQFRSRIRNSNFDNLPQVVANEAENVVSQYRRNHSGRESENIIELINNYSIAWLRNRNHSIFGESLDNTLLRDTIRRIGAVVNHPLFQPQMADNFFRQMQLNSQEENTITGRLRMINTFVAILDAARNCETFRIAVIPILRNRETRMLITKIGEMAQIINQTTEQRQRNSLGNLTAQALRVTRGDATHGDQRPFVLRDLIAQINNTNGGRTVGENIEIAAYIDANTRTNSLGTMTNYFRLLRNQNITGEQFREFFDLVEGARPEFRRFIFTRPDQIFGTDENAIARIVGSVARARAELRRLNEIENNELIVNFAYGIAILGVIRTRSLAQTNGIRYFCRYTRELLQESYAHSQSRLTEGEESTTKGYLIAQGRDDWNGAFYYNAHKHDQLRRGYRVVIIEDNNDNALFRRALQMRNRIGSRFWDGTLAGHGNATSIQLGRTRNDGGLLDTNDSEIRSILPRLFRRGCRITLNACSTGRNSSRYSIGEMIADTLGGTVYAPPTDAALQRYILNSAGRVVGARFDEVRPGLERVVPRRN